MTTSTLKPGDLIIDASGREAIVVNAVERPDEYWIRGQNDWRVRKIGKCAWWRAIPFSGGTELVPEPLARFLRPATVDDALRFSENWYQSYTALVALFPELARRMAAPSLSGEARGAGVRTVWFPEVPPPSPVFMPRDLDAEAKAMASGPNPMHEQDIAQDLGAAGDYAGALERFLWCFDYGKLARPSYAGVRSSFLIGDILNLSKSYAPALDALVARRDAAYERLTGGYGTRDDVVDFFALNREFGQSVHSLALFDSMDRKDKLRKELGRWIDRILLKLRRYGDLMAVYSPQQMLQEDIGNLSLPCAEQNPGLKAALRDMLSRRGGMMVEALAGTGRRDEALALARAILRVVRRSTIRGDLIAHARRAGDEALAEALQPRARTGKGKQAGSGRSKQASDAASEERDSGAPAVSGSVLAENEKIESTRDFLGEDPGR